MNTKNEETKLLDLQIITTIIYIASLILSIYLTYNDKLELFEEKPLFDDKLSNKLAIFNRVLIVILSLSYLYISNKNINIVSSKKENIFPFKLQLVGSELSTLATVVVLYAVLLTSGEQYSIVSGIGNPNL